MRIPMDVLYAVSLIRTLRHKDANTTLKEVCTLSGLKSMFMLEQVARKLRDSKVIESKRGPGGGYMLSDDYQFDPISLQEIFKIMKKPSILSGSDRRIPNNVIYLEQALNNFISDRSI